jgi:hypothetical protein
LFFSVAEYLPARVLSGPRGKTPGEKSGFQVSMHIRAAMRMAQARQGPFADQLTLAYGSRSTFRKKEAAASGRLQILSSSNVEKLLNTPILRSVGTAAREPWVTIEVTPGAGRIVAAERGGRSRANCGCAVGRDLSAGGDRAMMAMMMRGNMHVVRMRGCLRTRDR